MALRIINAHGLEWLLHLLRAEHKNVAGANKGVVAKLMTRLNFYLAQRCGAASSCPCYGGVPTASSTPGCPPCKGKNESHVGRVVAPWC